MGINDQKEVDSKKHLTVAELISKLQKMPSDYLVMTEGCDCWGEACNVVANNDNKYILIERL